MSSGYWCQLQDLTHGAAYYAPGWKLGNELQDLIHRAAYYATGCSRTWPTELPIMPHGAPGLYPQSCLLCPRVLQDFTHRAAYYAPRCSRTWPTELPIMPQGAPGLDPQSCLLCPRVEVRECSLDTEVIILKA